jgi:hypothetical protein
MCRAVIPILRQIHRLEQGIFVMTPPLRSYGLGCGIPNQCDPLEAIKHDLTGLLHFCSKGMEKWDRIPFTFDSASERQNGF